MSAVIKGQEKLVRKLREIGPKFAKKALKSATSGAMTVVSKESKKRARKQDDALAKAIGKRTRIYRGSGIAVTVVGPRYKATDVNGRDLRGLAKAVEFDGDSYMRATLNDKKDDVRKEFVNRAWRAIKKIGKA